MLRFLAQRLGDHKEIKEFRRKQRGIYVIARSERI
jgi:hypothetical protein